MFKKLIKIIKKRIKSKNKESYCYNLSISKQLYKKKIIEEALEFILELKKNNKKRIINEFCDLLFHSLIAISMYKIKYKNLCIELKKRNKKK
ncbi:MAG: phosphoribosyl-ATP diphosphatase [Candidatus Vidania fulgoroideorum]